jgi:putative OPT family oligopeptide transporter
LNSDSARGKAKERNPVEDGAAASRETSPPEFTFRAVFLGAVLGLVFGAVTVYIGLRSGLNISPSLPIAVLSITALRFLSRYLPPYGETGILENNIVQTTGSAGESVAAGVIFTIPALLFLGFSLEYSRILLLAVIGGFLGIFFMIPLRRQLIVKEHGKLIYPEGTACAEVLAAGDRGGSFVSRVFAGLGLGSVYALFQNENILAAWPGTIKHDPISMSGLSVRMDTSAEFLGIGYIIGPRLASVLLSGGLLSWAVFIPTIKFFGAQLSDPVYPGVVAISAMNADQLWESYIRYIGAGAVGAAGLLAVLRSLPTVLKMIPTSSKHGAASHRARTEMELPGWISLGGSVLCLASMSLILWLKPIEGADITGVAATMAALFVVGFGFLFATVSSRIVGLIGSSANPISGMSIATLIVTSGIFLAMGWVSKPFAALALTIGAVVCIACSNAGNTSQDLKTGFLVGATPRYQQLALIVGVLTSVLVIGLTLIAMERALQRFRPVDIFVDRTELLAGGTVETQHFEHQGKVFWVAESRTGDGYADGKFLYNPGTSRFEWQLLSGIGSEKAPAPQAKLMALVINGILTRKLPWTLLLIGVALVLILELLRVDSLAFAVGLYLPIAATLPMFCGGLVRWLGERGNDKGQTSDLSSGTLYAAGLISAGGVVGLLGIAFSVLRESLGVTESFAKLGPRLPILSTRLTSFVAYILLSASLYWCAKKPLHTHN